MTSTKSAERERNQTGQQEFLRISSRGWIAVVAGVAAVAYAALNSGRSVAGTRIGRPEGSFVPRRTEFLGISNWYIYFEIGSLVVFSAVWTTAIVRSRRRGSATPTLLMMTVTTALTWLDPVMNWAPYAAYDPRMFHFNVDWLWFKLAPTVEPWAVTIGYGYFFLLPAWLTLALYRRLCTRMDTGSWLVRRPMLAVLALSLPICIVWDGVMEALFVQMGFYTYTQVIPLGSIFVGTPGQFPLIWEAVLFGAMLSIAAPLMWVDDTGQTWPQRTALRFKAFDGRPFMGTFVVAFTLMSVAYVGYGLAFGIVRASGVATEVAQPWRYPETKVYDPQGYYRDAGEHAPFTVGTWGGWERRHR